GGPQDGQSRRDLPQEQAGGDRPRSRQVQGCGQDRAAKTRIRGVASTRDRTNPVRREARLLRNNSNGSVRERMIYFAAGELTLDITGVIVMSLSSERRQLGCRTP